MRILAAWVVAAIAAVSCSISFWAPAAAALPCPNEALRTGPSAHLPDCRAYELLTPPDTNGRLVGAITTYGTPPIFGNFPTELVSPSRKSFVYFTYSSPLLSPAEPNGNTDLYEAERADTGWMTTRRISPPGAKAEQPVPGGVSKDHSYASTNVGGTLSPMALGGQTEYLANPDGTFELVGTGELGNEPSAQTRWITEAGSHVVFTTGKSLRQSVWCSGCAAQQLESEAPPTGTGAIYDRRVGGSTRVVSLLPGNVPQSSGDDAFFKGVNEAGTAVAFTIKGTLYVRLDNAETQEVADKEPTFAGLSESGRYVFYLSGGNIHRFDSSTEEDDQVNGSGDAEVVHVSPDGSHVYFISPSQLDGAKGTVGQPNLYVWSGVSPEYVATVAPSDLNRTSGAAEGVPALANWTESPSNSTVLPGSAAQYGPGASPTRSTPDGNVLVFESRAQLTAFNNSGHTAIFRYDDAAKDLQCISCNPTADSAAADARLQQLILTTVATVIHNVSIDGSRVFFETPEALVDEDTDGVNDIYEWREQEGKAPSIELISSGRSTLYSVADSDLLTTFAPAPNVLLSITPDGKDVVFLSQDVLVPGAGEGGTSAIYDARVEGGFPLPSLRVPCEEDRCRPGASSPPSTQAPLSEISKGDGNFTARKHRKRGCPRGNRARRQKDRKCKTPSHRRRVRVSGASSSTAPISAPPLAERMGAAAQGGPPSGGSPTSQPSVSLVSPYDEFGIESVAANANPTASGMYPDFTTNLVLNHFINEKGRPESSALTEEVAISLPPGMIGNPLAIPRCGMAEFMRKVDCPIESQVGVTTVLTTLLGRKVKEPLYNLQPPHPANEVARFGFLAVTKPVYIDVRVRTATDYGVTATVHSSPALTELLGAETTIWGSPADSSHDEERLTPFEALTCVETGTACEAGGKRESTLDPAAFIANPSGCQSMKVDFAVRSYQLPGKVVAATAPMDPTTDCKELPFQPRFFAQPVSSTAGAATGLKTTLVLPQQSSKAVDMPATATMREARVSLPVGMSINPAAADGIAACSEEQVGFHQEVDAACPDASKLGTATITSPALAHPLSGEVFQRTPSPGRQFGLWLVTDELGLHVKIPGEIEPDKATGQLTAVFRDLPQVPVSQINLDIWGGPRAPLQNPERCGTYATAYSFAPYSQDPPVSGQSQMTIDEGCDKGFSPAVHAGTTNPVAGQFSPFVFDLQREDAEQNLEGFELTLPDGLLAKPKGVGLCPEALAPSGSCPIEARLGSVTAAAGAGPNPFWIPEPGKSPTAVYFAGPYQGAPFSVITVVPAQAGPFDLGNVVVRSALKIDRESARATVEANPLPQFFEGVGLSYRRLHVVIDRPDFTLNPTDCSELQITSRITSTQGAVANPSSRFQVDGCKALKFKPKLTLRLKGGTKRGDYPALSATLKARKGDANIGKVSVALPHSEFLAQEHIGTICTRKQFVVGQCPRGSVYGRAKAWTPLLAKPLEGPVYLRSSDNPLPDMVMSFEGEIDVALVGRIDSVHQGLRATFDAVPDAPVTKFTLNMRGGAKSVFVNSTDICRGSHRATVRIGAQNGRERNSRPVLTSTGCRR